jgi:hypothetical protein
VSTASGITLAGLGLSLAILYLNWRKWWKGGRKVGDLIPFSSGFLLGALGTVCTGGLLGWLSGCTRQAVNTAGGKVVPGATGTSDGAIEQGSLGQLSPEGGVVVFVLAVGVAAAYKAAGKDEKKRMTGGLICGFTLCVTAGIAGILNDLPTAINAVGVAGRGLFEGKVGL